VTQTAGFVTRTGFPNQNRSLNPSHRQNRTHFLSQSHRTHCPIRNHPLSLKNSTNSRLTNCRPNWRSRSRSRFLMRYCSIVLMA
jgi:hypothetical protein